MGRFTVTIRGAERAERVEASPDGDDVTIAEDVYDVAIEDRADGEVVGTYLRLIRVPAGADEAALVAAIRAEADAILALLEPPLPDAPAPPPDFAVPVGETITL